MGVADELVYELFLWIDQQEKCADDIMALAIELEDMRQSITISKCVVNSAIVLGSATLIGTGIATLLTGGVAAPLIIAASTIVGTGTAVNFTLPFVEKWKSSKAMENAEKTSKKIEKIWTKIEMLQKKLSEECRMSQDLKGENAMSSSTDEQFEITVRLLEALARRSGRVLPRSQLRNLLRNNHMCTHRCEMLNPNIDFLINVSSLLTVLGFSFIFLKTSKSGTRFYTSLLVKTALKGTGQVAGGLLGLALTLPDLVKNCEELVKKQHQTDASKYLKEKANKIQENVKKVKKTLNELEEILNQTP